MMECPHKPELEKTMGMYHCPECEMMVLAGVPHLVSDGIVCLGCGAYIKREGGDIFRGDPDCEHCSFKSYVPPPEAEDVDF